MYVIHILTKPIHLIDIQHNLQVDRSKPILLCKWGDFCLLVYTCMCMWRYIHTCTCKCSDIPFLTNMLLVLTSVFKFLILTSVLTTYVPSLRLRVRIDLIKYS